jgi:hypothetical protein
VWLSPWEYSSSDWAGLTFIVLVVALLIAWRQVAEARRLREDQARPFVIIDFHAWHTIIELRITNIGTTLARDVRFDFDPALASTHDATSSRGSLIDLHLFKNGIPALPPGKEITFFFDQYPPRIDQGLPMTYQVRASYTDPAGKAYAETTVLDLLMYRGTGGITRHDIHDIHKQLEAIAKEMKRWSDFDGLKVLTRDDLKNRNAEREALYEERAARAAQATEEVGSQDDSSA